MTPRGANRTESPIYAPIHAAVTATRPPSRGGTATRDLERERDREVIPIPEGPVELRSGVGADDTLVNVAVHQDELRMTWLNER